MSPVNFIYAGFAIVEKYQLSVAAQVAFWPTLLVVSYWVAIREIYIPRKTESKAVIGSVVIEFPLRHGEYGSNEERAEIHKFADVLDSMTRDSKVGEYDGDEFGAGRCKLFFYSDEPEKLFARIESKLQDSPFSDGMAATLTEPQGAESCRRIEF